MSELNKQTLSLEAEASMNQEYDAVYAKKVHTIGRITLVIALILSFLPVAYMYFVVGWKVSPSVYLNVTFALVALCLGMWITEPLTWYPILGAAPTYMAYLAGNVKNIRVPVVRSIMKKFNLEHSSPRGQILATFGVGVSVFVNMAILAVIIFTGSYFVPLLPDFVLTCLSYVIPALIGALIWFRVEESGWLKTLLWSVPAIVTYIVVHQLNIEALSDIAESISIALTIFIGYITYRAKLKKDPEDA